MILIFTVILLLSVTSTQLLISAAYWRQLSRTRQAIDSSHLPKAAIILSLRGSDPFLTQTLYALLKQDYPDYTIFLVIDHQDDSVWKQVNQVLEHAPKDKIVTTILSNPKTTCGLKCSALIQVIEKIDSSYSIVAFTDADVITHSTWLRDLASPLSDSEVGVTTGNRWYVPNGNDWGSHFRYVWNAGAVVQMWINRLVWGGSMAMRLDVIKRVGLLQAWQTSLSEDSVVASQIKKYGYKVAFIPHVMMCNREQTNFTSFFSWIQRQTYIGMSSKPMPMFIPFQAFFMVAIQFLGVFSVWGSLYSQHQTLLYLSSIAWCSYWVSSFLIMLLLEKSIRRINKINGQNIQWSNQLVSLKLIPTLLAMHIVFPLSFVLSMRRREFEWRGIKYKLDIHGHIIMQSYKPYMNITTDKISKSL
jgi:cellulose synthase/poly-beta-1,6-N-acetylglucosamine synthase-like glycosyltransferase